MCRAPPMRLTFCVVEKLKSHLGEIAIERTRSEEALARSNRLLEQVLDHLPVGVWCAGPRWLLHSLCQPRQP